MLLELADIAKRYNTPDGTDASYVLKDVTLQIAAGESVAVWFREKHSVEYHRCSGLPYLWPCPFGWQ